MDHIAEEAEAKPGRWRTFHDKFVVEERYVDPGTRRALYLTSILLAVVGLALFVATLIGVQQNNGLAGADLAAEQWMLTWRSQTLTTVMIVLAVIFGPIAMPIIIVVVTVTWSILAKHPWRPMLLAGAMVTGMVLTQISIRIVQRPRRRSTSCFSASTTRTPTCPDTSWAPRVSSL